jgi:sRNA-binding regulator protein Hfq
VREIGLIKKIKKKTRKKRKGNTIFLINCEMLMGNLGTQLFYVTIFKCKNNPHFYKIAVLYVAIGFLINWLTK